MGVWIAQLVVRGTRDGKVGDSMPGTSGGRIFSSSLFLLHSFPHRLIFGVRSTPVLPQWHVKGPGHSAKSAGSRLYLNMRTPLPKSERDDYAVQA